MPDDGSRTRLQSLVDNRVPESRALDYKQEGLGNADHQKREFLKDVSAFANTDGGELILGVAEDRDERDQPSGVPARAIGIAGINPDAEILRIESIIRDGIQPRISGCSIESVEGFELGPVLIVRIPRSMVAPHIVSFQGDNRFFARNSRGKYPMDVGELRSAFGRSLELGSRLRQYRENRIQLIQKADAPIPIMSNVGYLGRETSGQSTPVAGYGCLVLHVIPIAAFDPGHQVNPKRFLEPALRELTAPIYGYSFGHKFNVDGFLTFGGGSGSDERTERTYTQFFRDGVIEAADSRILEWDEKQGIPTLTFEERVIAATERYIQLLRTIDVRPPYAVLVSLLCVNGATLGVSGDLRMRDWGSAKPHRIDRHVVLLPEILVEETDIAVSRQLRPILDAFWQSAGWPGSENYDPDGNWRGRH